MTISSRLRRRVWAMLVAMTRLVAPRAPLPEQERQRRVRAYRVEAQGLPYCRLCGGTTAEVDDATLRCDCHDRRHEVEQRAGEILERVTRGRRNLADVIAP